MSRFAGSRAATVLFALASVATVLATWLTLLEWGVTEHFLGIWAITGALTFVAVLMHELGHALAALHYRQRIFAFAVFPFELSFRPLRLSMAAAHARHDTGGYVRHGGGDPSRYAVGVIAAAGPMASFALALIALCAAFALPLFAADPGASLESAHAAARQGHLLLPSDADALRWAELWAASQAQRQAVATGAGLSFALAVLSGGIGVANLVPIAGSDGEKILECLLRPFGSARLG